MRKLRPQARSANNAGENGGHPPADRGRTVRSASSTHAVGRQIFSRANPPDEEQELRKEEDTIQSPSIIQTKDPASIYRRRPPRTTQHSHHIASSELTGNLDLRRPPKPDSTANPLYEHRGIIKRRKDTVSARSSAGT